MKTLSTFLILLLATPFLDISIVYADALSNSKLSVRLGRPLVVRGPAGSEIDNAFNQIQLPTGYRRGFTANAKSYAIDGLDPWSMGGAITPAAPPPGEPAVLLPGAATTFNECGSWIFSTKVANGTTRGFIHAENECNYPFQTNKSFAYATSSDYGLTWTNPQQIINGMDGPTTGRITGEGDCTVVNGNDNYYYAYCLRNSDSQTIVARALISDPSPGNWIKYYGSWSQPGLGGNATALGNLGTGSGYMVGLSQIALFGIDLGIGGLTMSLSDDNINFYSITEPLVPLESSEWIARATAAELYAYPSTLNYTNGDNQLQNTFLLTNMYLQPTEGFDKRYLVFRDVSVTVSSQPVIPQVGLALSRWVNPASGGMKDNWSTTAPVPQNYTNYNYDALLGYVMTKPHPSLATYKLEECVINPSGDTGSWPGHIDHMLTFDGTCVAGGYTRLRTVGWVYVDSQPNTVPLYRCWNSTTMQHIASNSNTCDGNGSMEFLLGYALAN